MAARPAMMNGLESSCTGLDMCMLEKGCSEGGLTEGWCNRGRCSG